MSQLRTYGFRPMYLLVIIYALTLAPIVWVYVVEIWSLEKRATGIAPASVANRPFNFALGLSVPLAFADISHENFHVRSLVLWRCRAGICCLS